MRRRLLWIPGVLLLAAVVYLILVNAVFVVRNVAVEIRGESTYDASAVAQLSGISYGMKLSAIDNALITQRITDTGWLVAESTDLVYPDTVKLVVSVRNPVGIVDYAGTLAVVDKNGIVITTTESREEYPRCLYITNADITFCRVGRKLQSRYGSDIDDIEALLQAQDSIDCSEYVTSISLKDPDNITAVGINYINIRIGSKNAMQDKFEWIRTVIPDLVERGTEHGTLDVSGANHADYCPPVG